MLKRSLFGLIIVLMIASLGNAYPRKVLFEKFTNASCVPCANAAPTFEDFYEDNEENISTVSVHAWWPGENDPWYQIMSDYCQTRIAYYEIGGVPACAVDGVEFTNPGNRGNLNTYLNQRLAFDSPIDIQIESYCRADYPVTINLSITADADVTGNHKLRVHLAEVYSLYNAPNGQTEWYFDSVNMAPSAAGEDFSINAEETLTFEYELPWEPSYEQDNLMVVAFVQNDDTQEVIQSNSEPVIVDVPNVTLVDYTIDDSNSNHPDGRPGEDETIELYVNLENQENFQPALNLTAVLSCDNEDIVIDNAEVTYGDIQPGEASENTEDPFLVTIPMDFYPSYVTFTVELTADEEYSTTVDFTFIVGIPTILFVNDFGDGVNFLPHWEEMFRGAGFVPDIRLGQTVFADDLNPYETVVWSTSNAHNPLQVLNDLERMAISDYLDQGGKLILNSQYAGDTCLDDNWFETYLGAEHERDAISPPSSLGASGVESGLLPDAEVLMAGGGSGSNESPSTMSALTGAYELYTYRNVTDIAAVYYPTETFKSIYVGFALEAISGAQETDTAGETLAALLGLFDLNLDDVETETKILLPSEVQLSAYPSPFNPMLNISYVLPEAYNIQIEVMNLLGQQVATLYNGPASAGVHSTNWDASTSASGVYMLRLTTPVGVYSQKAMLLK